MDLKKERQNLIAQRDNAFSVYHQTIGAIALLDLLIAEQEEKGITLEELREMTGAVSIEEPKEL